MKFLRWGDAGREVPCVLDQNGVARDIRSVAPDIGPGTIDGLQAKLTNADLTALPEVTTDSARVSSPMAQPRNIYCIGLNYSDHAAESGLPIPDEPILFTKSSGTFCGPNDPILHSPKMTKLDWEVELGIDWQIRAEYQQGRGQRSHSGLHLGQRCVRARLATRTLWSMVQGQVFS